MALDVSLVTANARLARHLRWHADRQQASAGSLSAWPSVEILPWNAWLERLWRDSLMAGGEAGRFDLLTDQQSRLVWQKVTERTPAADLTGSRDFSSAIPMLINAWQLSHGWDIPIQSVRRNAAGPDSEAFADWAAHYEALCREREWVDSAVVPDLLRQELSSGRLALTRPIAFVGFDQFTPQQERMRQTIESLGQLRPAPVSDVQATRPGSVECADQQHEFELAARWSRRLFDDQKAGVVGILVPEGAARGARRVCLDIFCPGWRSGSPADLPVNVASGDPLSDIGVIHIALLMLGLPGEALNYRELGQLLRTPYIRGGEDEAMQRAALDVQLREQGLQEIDLRGLCNTGASPANGSTLAPGFLDILRRAGAWKSKLTGRHEPGHWAGEITNLLQDLGWPTGRSLVNGEQQATEAWARLLDNFAACSPVIGTIAFSAARRLLRRMAREQPFQPDRRMDGVQIMTAREASGHYFDGLWICGLSSDVWPPVPVPNPLIPLFLQRERGIPDASPQGTRAAADRTLTALLSSAPAVVASWPGRREEEDLVASPVLEAMTRLAPGSVALHGAASYREQIFSARKTEMLASDPAPALQSTEKVRGGSYLLKMQSACPARAFFEARLGAMELKVPPYGLDALTRGNIIHDALAFLYSKISDNGNLSELKDQQAESWIEEAAGRSLRKHFSLRHPLAQTLGATESRRIKALLWKMILLDRARPDFRPESVESSESVVLGPLNLSLRQDRIDRLGNGGRLLIDYKTGQGIKSGAWRGDRPAEPQLPLYAVTAEASGIAVISLNQDGVKLSGVGGHDLHIDGMQTPDEFLSDPQADWDGLLREWKDNLLALAQEFANGDCRINRLDTKTADGGFAMLTRIHDRSVMYVIGAEK
jgi:ATP-dependent helicase/nuclease subunit B